MASLLYIVLGIVALFCCGRGSFARPAISYSNLELVKAKQQLRRHRDATVHTIQSPDGDIVDCILREQQPAFHHPLLKEHTLEESPSSMPKDLIALQEETLPQLKALSSTSFSLFGTQLWHRKGRCPKGTIPIRRPSLTSLLNIDHSRKYRNSNFTFHGSPYTSILTNNPRSFQHEYALAQLDQESIYGTYAIFNAWKPTVNMQREMSIAQLWLVAGNYTDTFIDTVEAGWTVEPHAYGDNKTRFFIYWTNDFYKGNGCLDLRCPGFVHVSNDMVLGGTLDPISTHQGSQFEMQPILVWKDKATNNWWLRIGATNIGYWPASLFKNGLAEKARRVQWGGEITNTFKGGRHTETQMGSGRFADEGFGKASYVRSLHILDSSHSLSPVPAHSLQYITTDPACYSISPAFNQAWGSAFFFGGPGLNPNCQ